MYLLTVAYSIEPLNQKNPASASGRPCSINIRWMGKYTGTHFYVPKCNVLRISWSSKPYTFFYQLFSRALEVSVSKYLGVTICEDLKWGKHTDSICDKSNKNLGFLRRNLKYAPQLLNEQAYIPLVHSTMEYSDTLWDPYYQKDIDKLQKVEKRATSYIAHYYRYDTWSMTDLLNHWDSMPWKIACRRPDLPYSTKLQKVWWQLIRMTI